MCIDHGDQPEAIPGLMRRLEASKPTPDEIECAVIFGEDIEDGVAVPLGETDQRLRKLGLRKHDQFLNNLIPRL